MTTHTRPWGGEPTLDVARVTLQLESPVTIGTGQLDDLVDSMFVTDANGLPAIPGTSIAGMLRDRWAHTAGNDLPSAEDIFGLAPRRELGAKPTASRVSVSWAHLHDSGNRPRTGLLAPGEVDADPLLRAAAIPIVRQHVRLNAYGAADTKGHGLFDEAVVAAGHRFTFEIAVRGAAREVLDHLLAILSAPAARLGGKSRRGMGRFTLVGGKVRRRHFDLARDYGDFTRLPADIGTAPGDDILPVADAPAPAGSTTITLRLRPRGFWLFGGGLPEPSKGRGKAASEITADIVPYAEPRVTWAGDVGSIDFASPMLVVPATGIKGALRHRARFHAFRQRHMFADDIDRQWFERFERGDEPEPPAVVDLFGEIPSNNRLERAKQASANLPEGARELKARAGRLFLDDLTLSTSPPKQVLQHVSIDRFTQAPLDGHLFGEEALWRNGADGGPWLEATLTVDDPSALGVAERAVLAATLGDLVEGRLQVGAGSGRGHGWMEGEIDGWPEGWPDWRRTAVAEKEGA